MNTNLSVRSRKIFLVAILGGIISILFSIGINSPIAYAQEQGTPQPRTVFAVTITPDVQVSSRYYSVSTLQLSNGTLIERHNINGPSVPPAGFEEERLPVGLPQSDSSTTSELAAPQPPAYVLGCSPSAAGDIAKMHDRGEYPSSLSSSIQYPNLYTGPTNGGVVPPDNSAWPTWTDALGDTYSNNPLIASHQGVDGRTTRGTIDDYWVFYESTAPDPYITGGWQPHTPESLGDYMYSSQSARDNKDGSTTFVIYGNSARRYTCDVAASKNEPDGTLGRKLFYESRGYAVAECYNQPTDNIIAGGFSFAQFKAEIDAGRPVMIGLKGHNVVGIGYDAATQQIYIHDGWDYNTHTMPWGGSYAGFLMELVSIMNPIPVNPGAYTISGYVGVPNATIMYPGGSTKASISGYYSFSVVPGWSGTVTPSKPGYTFTPASRSYTNVPAYQTKQNYTATPIPGSNLLKDPSFELGRSNPYWAGTSTNFGTPLCDSTSCGGNGARTGSVWGWFGGTAQYPNETASLSQSVTIPSGTASLDFYLRIGDETAAGSDAADVFSVKVDGTTAFSANATQINAYSAYTPVSVNVSAYANGASHVITFSSVTSGQAVAFHLDDVSLAVTPLTSTPTISGNAGVGGTTLSYMNGAVRTVTSDSNGNYTITVPSGWSKAVTPYKTGYLFTPASRTYNNVQGNLTAQNYAAQACASCADVKTYIGAGQMGAYTVSSTIPVSPRYWMNGGPVHVLSTNSRPIFTSQRAIFGSSFNSIVGYPGNQLTTDYWFTSYDDLGMTTFLVIGNPSTSQTAQVNVYIGGNKMNSTPYSIAPGQRIFPRYGVNGGPVFVDGINGVNIFTSQRTKFGNSFNEIMGYPANRLTTDYWFTSYDDLGMITYLVIGNPSTSQTAQVDVYIAGVKKNNTPYSIAAGQRIFLRYGVNGGPVFVNGLNGVNIFASERTKFGDTFNEVMGYPANRLTTDYWFTSYDDVGMITYLVIGNPSTSTAQVDVYIAGVKRNATPYSIAPGQRIFLRYGINSGPVRVLSTNGVSVFASERSKYLNSFNEILGMADNQLTTDYWFTSYDDLGMLTSLVVGSRP